MKRYDDVTILKGLACLTVFTSHWLGSFGSFGSGRINFLMEQGPLLIITRGSYVVPAFLMLTSLLAADKVLAGRLHSWSEEIVKRYLRLVIPVAVTSILALLFFRAGLFRNHQAAALLDNAWLDMYYGTLPGWRFLPGKVLFGTVILGDDTYYGPFWMLNYTFLGSIFALVFANALRELRGRGQMICSAVLGLLFLYLDSYYLSIYLGCLLALLFRRLDAAWETQEREKGRPAAILLSVLLLAAASFLGMRSFHMAAWFAQRGIQGGLASPYLYGTTGAFFLIAAVRLLWLSGLSAMPAVLKRPLLWLGERSLGIYLTHWLFICSFSCWFYSLFFARGEKLAVGVNLILTLALMAAASQLYFLLVEGKLFGVAWGRLRRLLWEKETMSARQE